jgi:hypothetical protein
VQLALGEQELGAVEVEADVAAIDPSGLGVPDRLQRDESRGTRG